MKKNNIDCLANQNISKFIAKNYIKVPFNTNTNDVFDMMMDKKLDYAVVVDDKDYPIGIVDIYTLYDVIIKLKIRNVKLSVDNIELESSIEKDRFIKELKKEMDILNEQSIIDHITNLYNIRYFYKVIEEEADVINILYHLYLWIWIILRMLMIYMGMIAVIWYCMR